MSGDARNYSHRGIIPRALQHVFRDVDMRTDRIYSISVSYLEIYNESLRDLLSDDPAASDSLAILDDAANTVVRKSCSRGDS
jgi:kinesin family protein 6/9